jgi:chromosome partitioning protein
MDKKVLVIDIDPQSNLTQSFGLEEPENNVYMVLRGLQPATPIPIMKNLDCIASTLDLSGAELELSNEPGREYMLKEIIDAFRNSYDFIFIDCPPTLGLLTINALTAADEVYIPLQAHYLAMKGLTKIIEVVEKIRKRLNRELSIEGVVITQFDNRKILNRDVAEAIEEFFGDKVFKTRIRNNISLAEAPSVGTDIFRYSPKSMGAQDYLQLCVEIEKKYATR